MTSVAALARLLVPDFSQSQVAIAAPETGAGYWAGAPSALYTNGVFYLAYRLRRPVAKGRGYAVHLSCATPGLIGGSTRSMLTTRPAFGRKIE
jgi:hypothetical protein